tara:strand:- start:576 stop:710 length:135 start_codon:yes stop_codon:yes gene_type:complete
MKSTTEQKWSERITNAEKRIDELKGLIRSWKKQEQLNFDKKEND